MIWGVFDLVDTQDEVHIVPTCWGGHVLSPHSLTYRCPCKPDFEDDVDGALTVLHRELKGITDV